MNKRILIVEDQEDVRELVTVTLSLSEYEILEAANGADAVAMVKESSPRLVLMDVGLPGGMNGLEATRIIKNDPDTCHCRVIMLTANGQQSDREAGFQAGADGYFTKPFSPLELIQRVEQELM